MALEYLEDFVELVFGFCLLINAALFIPQAVKVYSTKDASGLSYVTFLGFNIIQVFTILHGCIHNDYALVFGFSMSLLTSGAVTFLIFSYRKNSVR